MASSKPTVPRRFPQQRHPLGPAIGIDAVWSSSPSSAWSCSSGSIQLVPYRVDNPPVSQEPAWDSRPHTSTRRGRMLRLPQQRDPHILVGRHRAAFVVDHQSRQGRPPSTQLLRVHTGAAERTRPPRPSAMARCRRTTTPGLGSTRMRSSPPPSVGNSPQASLRRSAAGTAGTEAADRAGITRARTLRASPTRPVVIVRSQPESGP